MKNFLEPMRELKEFRKEKMLYVGIVRSVTSDFSKTMQAWDDGVPGFKDSEEQIKWGFYR